MLVDRRNKDGRMLIITRNGILFWSDELHLVRQRPSEIRKQGNKR